MYTIETFGLYYFFQAKGRFLEQKLSNMIDKMTFFISFTLWALMAFISLLSFTTFSGLVKASWAKLEHCNND